MQCSGNMWQNHNQIKQSPNALQIFNSLCIMKTRTKSDNNIYFILTKLSFNQLVQWQGRGSLVELSKAETTTGWSHFPSDPIPIILYGPGNYALTDIKEIKTTADYLGLGEEVTECQQVEEYDKCAARKYRERVLEECHCSPMALKSFFHEKV